MHFAGVVFCCFYCRGRSANRNEFSIFLKLMLKTYKPWKQRLKCDCGVQKSCLKIKLCKKICFSKKVCTFLHFLQCKFTWRTNLKDFRELVLTYVRPSEKCKDFMKNFPKNFDPIFGVAVVKLGFTLRLRLARRPQGGAYLGELKILNLPESSRMGYSFHFCDVRSLYDFVVKFRHYLKIQKYRCGFKINRSRSRSAKRHQP